MCTKALGSIPSATKKQQLSGPFLLRICHTGKLKIAPAVGGFTTFLFKGKPTPTRLHPPHICILVPFMVCCWAAIRSHSRPDLHPASPPLPCVSFTSTRMLAGSSTPDASESWGPISAVEPWPGVPRIPSPAPKDKRCVELSFHQFPLECVT